MPFYYYLKVSVKRYSILKDRPHNPYVATPVCLHIRRFGLYARSLAATSAVSVDFLSFGYLDVSVPQVSSIHPI